MCIRAECRRGKAPGEPYEGKLHVRFDEGVLETELWSGLRHRCKGESLRKQKSPLLWPLRQRPTLQMRNLLQAVRKRDYDSVKEDAQAIYTAANLHRAQTAFQRFQRRWRKHYPLMVKRLENDLPELLAFFQLPKHLWKKLRTTNIIERCFVEVRRRTRPRVCFVNIHSVDRIIFSIFNRFNEQWKNHTLRVFTQAA